MMLASGTGKPMRGKSTIGWHAAAAIGLSLPGLAMAFATPMPEAKVERAVIDALPAWQGRRATILKYLDLTQPFATSSPWALVVARDARPPPADLAMTGNASPIAVCFVEALVPACTEARGHPGDDGFDMTNELAVAAVVFVGPPGTRPLLMLQTWTAHGMNGSARIGTKLFRYDRKANGFRKVFANVNGGTNNNARTRFVKHGPLRGDVIVNYPTSEAPYAYWVDVYAPGRSGRYTRILRYRSITRYGDGNALAVADSEMPEIMRRLGFWKPGDALPVPPHEPRGCGGLVMRRGEEWCKTARVASTPQQQQR